MTEILFHVQVAQPIDYACRLLRKALARAARVVVAGPGETLAQLDHSLWTFSALDFLPHCFADAPDAVLRASPIVLLEQPQGSLPALPALPHHEVLVHLGTQVPQGFETFERLIEVVSTRQPELLQARTRWRYYAERGYVPQKYEHAASPPQVASAMDAGAP